MLAQLAINRSSEQERLSNDVLDGGVEIGEYQAPQLKSRFLDDVPAHSARPVSARIMFLPAVPPEGPPRSRCDKLVDADRSPLSCDIAQIVSTSVRDRGCRSLVSTAAHSDHLGPAIREDCCVVP